MLFEVEFESRVQPVCLTFPGRVYMRVVARRVRGICSLLYPDNSENKTSARNFLENISQYELCPEIVSQVLENYASANQGELSWHCLDLLRHLHIPHNR